MSSPTTEPAPAELSRPFPIARLTAAAEHEIDIVATPAERAALAARCGLIVLDDLRAHLTIARAPSGEIVATGQLQAELTQECVVTLEPVRESVAAPFEQRYTLRADDPVGDLVIGPDDAEPPEVVTGETIDLGELVAQFLSLSINPYPRSASADAHAAEYRAEAGRDGPFAALARLRDRDPT